MTTSTPLVNIQGNPVQASQIDPTTFYRLTRRQRGAMAASITSFAGLGNDDTMELTPTGILAAIEVKFVGSLVVTPGTGTVATTAKWPYSMLKLLRLSANGQSNLIEVNGMFLKAREIISNPSLSDRGVQQTIGGVTVDQGTLALASESWGVGQSTSSIAAGTYPVELTWRVPVAWDLLKILGSLYLQTASTSVVVNYNWASPTDLFTLTGDGAVTLTGGLVAEGIVFTIPVSNGMAVLPDLSVFHSFTQNVTANVAQAANSTVLAGQGNNKQLMRILGNVWSGSTSPGAPLAMNATNFGKIGWGYSLSETPEVYQDGNGMALDVERSYSSALGMYQGLMIVDFARHWSFRDSVDEGAATQLHLDYSINTALTNPRLEYAQEVIINAASAA